MITMLVAMFTVDWQFGWAAIADASSWLSNGVILLNENAIEAPQKLQAAKSISQEYGHCEWLTSSGKVVILNNAIEFAVAYFIMRLSLFFTGGGGYTSLDYVLKQGFLPKQN